MPVYGPCGAQPTACRGGTAVRRRSAAKSTAAGCGAAAEGIRLSLAIASQLMRHSHTVAWRPVGFISEYASAAVRSFPLIGEQHIDGRSAREQIHTACLVVQAADCRKLFGVSKPCLAHR